MPTYHPFRLGLIQSFGSRMSKSYQPAYLCLEILYIVKSIAFYDTRNQFEIHVYIYLFIYSANIHEISEKNFPIVYFGFFYNKMGWNSFVMKWLTISLIT